MASPASKDELKKKAGDRGLGGNAGERPPNPAGAAKATQDNDLTTGHSDQGDGGDDNSKPENAD